MVSKFINREYELNLLNSEWETDGARLVVLYGRRRVGKTRLLLEFVENKEGIFYIAEDVAPGQQIEELKRKVSEFLDDPLLLKLEIKDWNTLLEYLVKNAPDKRFYLVLDEFSYLIKSDKRILSYLQKLWDLKIAKTKMFLVLSGSLLGLMSERVLSHSSPLYGRRSRDILLGGLPFPLTSHFVPFSLEGRVVLYLIIGGVPEYLLKASEHGTLRDFLEGEFFKKDGYFYREPYFIISQEFRELKTYFSILSAIAYGNTKPGEISSFIGMEARKIYPYLENLIRLGFIERVTPVLGDTKKGLYIITDDVFDFWFNFVYRNREEIERGSFSFDEGSLSPYLGKKFEVFVRKEVFRHLPCCRSFLRTGKWWHREEEIDIVALNDAMKKIAFFEVKWSALSKSDANRILRELKRKAGLVKWHNRTRREEYGIIAREIEDKEALKSEGYHAYDLADFEFLPA